MRRAAAVLFVVPFILFWAAAQEAPPAYRNANLPIAQRVADLLKRMTLEQKVEQITGGNPQITLDPTGKLSPERGRELFRELFTNIDATLPPRDAANLRNAAQRYRVEKTPLGIPTLFMGEALHGYMAYGSTSFPIPLALASTWDPALVNQVFTAASDEMSAAGTRQAFTPVLDLGRDPRWGRTEETYGEDPYLVSRMAVAAVEGLQGTLPANAETIGPHHVLATMKHFAAHGQPQGGVNTGPVNISERTLRETFFVPFKAAVEEAHVRSVMASYNEINGIPSHVNHWLLDDILRKEWGFNGYVASDGNGLQMLYEVHHVAAGPEDAASRALAAGVDFDLSNGSVYRTLIQQVKDGKVPESEVDQAAGRVLAEKFRLGLFEHPYVDPAYAETTINSAEHRKLALRAAEESIVLLKNENHLLPLDSKKLKTVAVIGPDAADLHLGGYARDPGPGVGVTILEGIRRRLEPSAHVVYAEGCKITQGKQGVDGWYENNTLQAEPSGIGIERAAAVAKSADVAILVVGETEATNREAWSDLHRGDRDSLDLLGQQEELIRAVLETGTPTIVLLINGRPLSVRMEKEHVPAILEGWYLGEEGGTAAAEVLFGDVNPSGKLPITFPKSVGQIPIFYNHKPSSLRNYIFSDRAPLFPFGYGMSYTTFRYDNLRIEPETIPAGGHATARVDVTNTGDREGDEIAEMYVHQRVSDVTRAVIELKGFHRVHLKPGEKTTVEFAVTPEALSMWNMEMKFVVEPGTFDIEVGPNSEELQTVPLIVTEH